MKTVSKIIAKGFGIGIADVIPGVSGGTMALIFGIYHRLIEAIKSFDKIWLQGIIKLDVAVILYRPHFSFLLPLGIGIMLAVFCFTRLIPLPLLLHRYPEMIYGLFCGLIFGSALVLIREVGIYSFKELRFLIAGIAIGHLIFNMVPVTTPDADWFIFFSGAIAMSAALLPGISGSFILLMLKKYAYILNAIGHFDLAVIIPFTLGMITGLISFSRVLSWLLKNWPQETLATIIGLLIASLSVLWPFQQRIYETIKGQNRLIQSIPYLPQQLTLDVGISIALMIIGLLTVLILRYLLAEQSLFRKANPEE